MRLQRYAFVRALGQHAVAQPGRCGVEAAFPTRLSASAARCASCKFALFVSGAASLARRASFRAGLRRQLDWKCSCWRRLLPARRCGSRKRLRARRIKAAWLPARRVETACGASAMMPWVTQRVMLLRFRVRNRLTPAGTGRRPGECPVLPGSPSGRSVLATRSGGGIFPEFPAAVARRAAQLDQSLSPHRGVRS